MEKILLLTALVFAARMSEAEGIFHITFNSNLPPASIDLDGDGQDDFSVSWCGYFIGTMDVPQSFATTHWTLEVLSGGSIGMGDGGGVAAGTVIDAASGFWGAPGTGDMLASLLEYPRQNRADWTGVLAPVASGLIAVSFTAQDGFTHYGWIRFRHLHEPPAADGGFFEFGPRIAEFAWNTVPNEAIKAGQISEPVSFTANLTGANEVPPNRSGHSGTGTFTLGSFVNGFVLDYCLELDGAFVPTSAGIFGPANREERPPILIADLGNGAITNYPPPIYVPLVTTFDFPSSTSLNPPGTISWVPSLLIYDGQITLSSNQALQLARGQLYVNLKSARFRQGELRGQIWPDAPIQFTATLTGRGEPPRNPGIRHDEPAYGEAAFTLSGANLDGNVALNKNISWSSMGIYGSSAAPSEHLMIRLTNVFGVMIPAGGFPGHPDWPGLRGQVLYPEWATLTDRQVVALKSGQLFLQLISSRNRNGQISGRLFPE